MNTGKRFWMAALGWSGALCVLLGAYSLLVHFTSATNYRGSGAAVLALHSVAGGLGLFFPLIVFFAALGPLATRSPDRPVMPSTLVAAPLAAGTIEYIWLGFVAPWWKMLILRWTGDLAGVAIDPAPAAATQTWLATQLSNSMVSPDDARLLTWLFHQPLAMGLLTILLSFAGFLMGRRASTGVQRWSVATLVSVIIAPTLLVSLRLTTQYGIPPEAAAYGVLIMPLFLLVVLGWITWTDHERTATAAIS